MHNRRFFSLIFYVMLMGLFLFMPAAQPAYACEPTSTPEGGLYPTEVPEEIVVAQKSQMAAVIVEGRVLDFKSEGADGTTQYDVVFEVSQYDKGSGPQRLLLTDHFRLDCPMVPPFQKDEQLILLLSSQPSASGAVGVMSWYGTYYEEVVKSIRQAAGGKSHAPDATPVGQLPYTSQPTYADIEARKLWAFGIIAAILILIFVGLLFLNIYQAIKRLPPNSK